MINKVYIDCDIILDLLTKRPPFYQFAARLFALIEAGRLKGYVSPLSFANLFYILRKLRSNQEAGRILSNLRLLVEILPINEDIIDLALHSHFSDFEDALHYYTALKNNIEILITRNKKHY